MDAAQAKLEPGKRRRAHTQTQVQLSANNVCSQGREAALYRQCDTVPTPTPTPV